MRLYQLPLLLPLFCCFIFKEGVIQSPVLSAHFIAKQLSNVGHIAISDKDKICPWYCSKSHFAWPWVHNYEWLFLCGLLRPIDSAVSCLVEVITARLDLCLNYEMTQRHQLCNQKPRIQQIIQNIQTHSMLHCYWSTYYNHVTFA